MELQAEPDGDNLYDLFQQVSEEVLKEGNIQNAAQLLMELRQVGQLPPKFTRGVIATLKTLILILLQPGVPDEIHELALNTMVVLFNKDRLTFQVFYPENDINALHAFRLAELSQSGNDAVKNVAFEAMSFFLKYSKELDYMSFDKDIEVARKLRRYDDVKMG